jgi:hypothetical protein
MGRNKVAAQIKILEIRVQAVRIAGDFFAAGR